MPEPNVRLRYVETRICRQTAETERDAQAKPRKNGATSSNSSSMKLIVVAQIKKFFRLLRNPNDHDGVNKNQSVESLFKLFSPR